jgi:hypothetical protein
MGGLAPHQAAAARVQGAHAAREAAVNALSRAERRERELAEREAERAREEKSAAAAARAAVERAEREAVEAADAADRLALRLQRAELLAIGGLREVPPAPVTVAATVSVPIPVHIPVPAPAPAPTRMPKPAPTSVAMTAFLPVPPLAPMHPMTTGVKLLPAHMRPLPPPPPPQYHYAMPWIPTPATHYVHVPWSAEHASAFHPDTPSPQSTSPRDDVGSAETDSTCIVCMDAACDVTTTCCARTFMCAACSTRVKRCPLCDSLEFVCLPDELL